MPSFILNVYQIMSEAIILFDITLIATIYLAFRLGILKEMRSHMCVMTQSTIVRWNSLRQLCVAVVVGNTDRHYGNRLL